MHELVWLSETEEETQRCGRLFAQNCQSNAIILFSGMLGVGKTVFIRGLARGFGVKNEVSSPSFNLMNAYEGARYKFFHIDAFRERSLTWDSLNLDDIVTEPFCCAIEWAEHFSRFPEDVEKFYVTIELVDDQRMITIKSENKNFLCALSTEG
ncbi:MAG: tRNA (adenosine(37)-N6)-threonylcarbamoyltransferase complex ATPase subunit type 1 TsaE [Puniceicoccales bacterium]|jgi:tRNA threonylcarbamoyladenosine biosynthesis protein TsaE|nr:tRNA (adenosine(37)-N6)-threonylcarbamoyltransferase complex ATPase subunit type 1 TsaE [Puniceicoccales bacterium]